MAGSDVSRMDPSWLADNGSHACPNRDSRIMTPSRTSPTHKRSKRSDMPEHSNNTGASAFPVVSQTMASKITQDDEFCRQSRRRLFLKGAALADFWPIVRDWQVPVKRYPACYLTVRLTQHEDE